MSQSPTTPRLTRADVAKLLSDRSAAMRIDTTAKIAAQFDSGMLSPVEMRLAEDIFRILAKDAELRVREALSTHLKSSPDLPRDVALALAQDVDSVALPVLKFSEVLTDRDLIAIVRGPNPAKQLAIAQRRSVSAKVSAALVDSGNERAVAWLLGNEGAAVSEAALDQVLQEYRDSTAVSDALARRPNLPASIAERVVVALTERLHAYLVAKHDLPQDVASNLILQARERATISLLDYGSSDVELEDLIEHLHRAKRLSPSLLLRALCVGDLNFFERALARLTNLPLKNVRILIHDKGMLGLEPLCLRANLPKALFPAFRVAVQLVAETDYDGGSNDRARYVERMLERMLTHFEDPAERIAPADVEYLMAKLRRVAA